MKKLLLVSFLLFLITGCSDYKDKETLNFQGKNISIGENKEDSLVYVIQKNENGDDRNIGNGFESIENFSENGISLLIGKIKNHDKYDSKDFKKVIISGVGRKLSDEFDDLETIKISNQTFLIAKDDEYKYILRQSDYKKGGMSFKNFEKFTVDDQELLVGTGWIVLQEVVENMDLDKGSKYLINPSSYVPETQGYDTFKKEHGFILGMLGDEFHLFNLNSLVRVGYKEGEYNRYYKKLKPLPPYMVAYYEKEEGGKTIKGADLLDDSNFVRIDSADYEYREMDGRKYIIEIYGNGEQLIIPGEWEKESNLYNEIKQFDIGKFSLLLGIDDEEGKYILDKNTGKTVFYIGGMWGKRTETPFYSFETFNINNEEILAGVIPLTEKRFSGYKKLLDIDKKKESEPYKDFEFDSDLNLLLGVTSKGERAILKQEEGWNKKIYSEFKKIYKIKKDNYTFVIGEKNNIKYFINFHEWGNNIAFNDIEILEKLPNGEIRLFFKNPAKLGGGLKYKYNPKTKELIW